MWIITRVDVEMMWSNTEVALKLKCNHISLTPFFVWRSGLQTRRFLSFDKRIKFSCDHGYDKIERW